MEAKAAFRAPNLDLLLFQDFMAFSDRLIYLVGG
jgi:hypothetical protein